MINIQEEILKSIEVMIDKSLNKYNSTRTEDAIVESIKNGKYQVTVDGTKCYVYDSVGCSPKVGNAVWVQIPNGNIHNAFITGRKNKSADGFFNGENTQNGGSSGGSSVSGTGTKDYNELNNKPSINGKTLLGNIVINSNDINYKGQQTVYAKLDELTNSIGSNVTVTQLTTQGTHIATINVDGNETDIIAPIPSKLSEMTSDANHRLVTDNDKQSWNANNHYGTLSKFEEVKNSLPVGASFDITDDFIDDITIGNLNDLATNDKTNIVNAINEVFQDVSDGKKLIADAITDKGVETSANDTFNTMATNIRNIPTGNSLQFGSYVVKRNTSAAQSFEVVIEYDGMLHWSCIKNNWKEGDVIPLLNGRVLSSSYPDPPIENENGINTYFYTNNGSLVSTYWEVLVKAGDVVTWSFSEFYNAVDNNGCVFMWFIEANE